MLINLTHRDNQKPFLFRKTTETKSKQRSHIEIPATWSAKQELPLLDAWSPGPNNVNLVVADFDVLPKNFNNFDDFVAYLNTLGVVGACKSPSGKAKAFILVKGQTEVDNQVALQMIDKVFGELGSLCDNKGTRQVFVTLEIYECIAKLLDFGSVFEFGTITQKVSSSFSYSNIVSDSSDNKSINKQPIVNVNKFAGFQVHGPINTKPSSFKYIEATDHCDVLDRFVYSSVKGQEERRVFARILTACYGLINSDDGYSLSQKVIANQCNVEIGTVNGWFQWLQKHGFLEKTTKSYRVGKLALKYIATGLLKDGIWQYKKDQQNRTKSLPLPQSGEFYKYLKMLSYRHVLKNSSMAEFLKEVAKIPGIHDKPDRLPMAKAIFQCDLRKHT